MLSEAGNMVAKFSDNVNVFPDLIALFQLASGTGGSGTYILSSSISRIWHSDYVSLNISRQYGNCIINFLQVLVLRQHRQQHQQLFLLQPLAQFKPHRP